MDASQRIGRAALALAAALAAATPPCAADGARKEAASRVEPISGSKVSRVILQPRATERLGIRTARVAVDGDGAATVPYSALLYDLTGSTWVYTVDAPHTYVRHAVVVRSIEGDKAILREGPPPGTPVVGTGAAELYGAEKGVGH